MTERADDRRKLHWKFWVPQLIGALIYLVIGSYQVGVFTQRMTAVEKSLDEVKQDVKSMAAHVEWRR